MNNNNNNKNKNNNTAIITSPIDLKSRFCRFCHLQLVQKPKDPSIYSCPRCNVSSVLKQTEPEPKLKPNFPTFSMYSENKPNIVQPESQMLSRSEYFIRKNQQKHNETEMNDPYLAMLRSNNKIRITNVEHYDPGEY